MEQIYNDFTTKLLPQIQQGLTITKDYFFDLFGRYVKYLIVIDSINLAIGITLVSVALIIILKSKNKIIEEYKKDWLIRSDFVAVAVPIVCVSSFLFGIIITFINLSNLIKDIYIPEVRIMDEISNLNHK